METLVCTGGRSFPLARLAEWLRCPRCGCRKVTVIFECERRTKVWRLAARAREASLPATSRHCRNFECARFRISSNETGRRALGKLVEGLPYRPCVGFVHDNQPIVQRLSGRQANFQRRTSFSELLSPPLRRRAERFLMFCSICQHPTASVPTGCARLEPEGNDLLLDQSIGLFGQRRARGAPPPAFQRGGLPNARTRLSQCSCRQTTEVV
jgi:hypothetical protein